MYSRVSSVCFSPPPCTTTATATARSASEHRHLGLSPTPLGPWPQEPTAVPPGNTEYAQPHRYRYRYCTGPLDPPRTSIMMSTACPPTRPSLPTALARSATTCAGQCMQQQQQRESAVPRVGKKPRLASHSLYPLFFLPRRSLQTLCGKNLYTWLLLPPWETDRRPAMRASRGCMGGGGGGGGSKNRAAAAGITDPEDLLGFNALGLAGDVLKGAGQHGVAR